VDVSKLPNQVLLIFTESSKMWRCYDRRHLF